MIEIRSLTALNSTDFERVAIGYSSNSKYVVLTTSVKDRVSFDLQLVALDQPYVKKFDHDNGSLQRYARVLNEDYSFGAYNGNLLVGFILGEPHDWNRSICVPEFHVAETYRQMGIGRKLMECVAQNSNRAGFRAIVCETQNTNVTAIEVYHKLGFRIEAIDISFYSNHDYPDGEMALFMKRRLP